MSGKAIIVLLVFFLTKTGSSFAQVQADTLILQNIDTVNLTGTYTNNHGTTLKLKENQKCKIVRGKIRPVTSWGSWVIRGDTVICYLRRTNTVSMGDNKRLRNQPEELKIISANGKLQLYNPVYILEGITYPVIYVDLEKLK